MTRQTFELLFLRIANTGAFRDKLDLQYFDRPGTFDAAADFLNSACKSVEDGIVHQCNFPLSKGYRATCEGVDNCAYSLWHRTHEESKLRFHLTRLLREGKTSYIAPRQRARRFSGIARTYCSLKLF